MQLSKKKNLAAKTLGVGKHRIIFTFENLSEIKEAITRQDILDLYKSKAIQIKEIKGRKKITKRKNKRKVGKVKKRINKSKQEYVIMTRKLRGVLKNLSKRNMIDVDKYKEARKMIRAKKYKSKRHLKEALEEMQ